MLDPVLAQAYALVLVAVARADDEISLEEGLRLQQILATRVGREVAIEDLLLAEPVDPDDLGMLAKAGPFRGTGVHPSQLAETLVADAIGVVLAKGHVAAAEARELLRYVAVLGCSDADFHRLTAEVSRWIPPLDD
jgi:hypothetical protein